MVVKFGEASTRARRWVNSQGFRLADEPDYEMPRLPADITSVHEEELMVIFSEVISWMDYVEVALTAAKIDAKQAEADLERIQALAQVAASSSEKNVTSAKARVYESASFLTQKDEFLLLDGRSKMLETMFNSLDRMKFIISREITRRKYGND